MQYGEFGILSRAARKVGFKFFGLVINDGGPKVAGLRVTRNAFSDITKSYRKLKAQGRHLPRIAEEFMDEMVSNEIASIAAFGRFCLTDVDRKEDAEMKAAEKARKVWTFSYYF